MEAHRLKKEGLKATRVGVITPYRQQRQCLQDTFNALCGQFANEVFLTTVHHCVLPCCAACCLLPCAVYAVMLTGWRWLMQGAAALHPDCFHFTGLACVPSNAVTAAHLAILTLHCMLPLYPHLVL